jgi:hypothetical protein
MTFANAESIQPGWAVWTSDGTELGTVIATDPTSFRVKTSGLRSREVTVPRDAIDEVETGRIELKLSKDDLAKLQ